MAMVGAAGAAMGAGAGAPGAFPDKSPMAVFFLSLVTCGIYSYFWIYNTAKAMEARGAEIGPFWHVFVPILGLLWFWKYCQGVEKVTNGQESAGITLVKLWFLGIIGMAMLQSTFLKLNGR